MFLALAGYVLAMRDRVHYGVGAAMSGHWRLERKLARLGWPIAVSFGLEHGAFFAAATFAGWLGAVPLAAYQIVINTMGLIYMLAIGLATATAVRVGNAVGRRDRPGLARAGWVGLGLGIAVMLALMPVLYGSSGLIVAIYTDDRAVAAIAVPALLLAAWLLVADASQGILTGALRGRYLGVHRHAVCMLLVDLHPVLLPIGAPLQPRRRRAAMGSVGRAARRGAAARLALQSARDPRGPAALIAREAAMFRVAALLLPLALGAPVVAQPFEQLALPIDCVPGADCWVLRYVDHDPGPGVRDYMCGGVSGDGHNGTDIAIRDLAAMAAGVQVRAAAAGVVDALRDGMADTSVDEIGRAAVGGKECGNGIRLAHGGGWTTWYCHLRRGSLIKQGDRVEAGQPFPPPAFRRASRRRGDRSVRRRRVRRLRAWREPAVGG
jgi:hypothetical protein